MAAAGRTGTRTMTGTQVTARRLRQVARGLAALAVVVTAGCINQPGLLPADRRRPIDRSLVEYPSGFALTPLVRGLNCPTAFCFDKDRGNLIVAESGIDGSEPHVFGIHLADGKTFDVYPFGRTVSFFPTHQVLYGPVGGMVVHHGRVYVSHRDAQDRGVITAFGYDGSHTTIVADLPAQGDFGVTDLCVNTIGGRTRLYFGIGTATNSGVVGLDNWDAGWVRRHPDVADRLFNFAGTPIKLYGARFDTLNPGFGIGQPDLKVTGAFQPFGTSNQSRIYTAAVPNGSICSVALDDGGDLAVESVGMHHPRGLAVDPYFHLWATNDGMDLRGTRPVANDPDVLIDVGHGRNRMWPDFTTHGHLVTEPAYAPPISMLTPHGQSELSPLIDAPASNIVPPRPGEFADSLAAVFPSLSGAAKLDFVPATGPFARFRGRAVVALDGDRAPYASGGLKLNGFVGGKIVLVDIDAKQAKDFVFNTARTPASRQEFGTEALERPIDVKFSPDHQALWILDFGQVEYESATPRYHNGTGAIYKLAPVSR